MKKCFFCLSMEGVLDRIHNQNTLSEWIKAELGTLFVLEISFCNVF